MFYLNCHCCLEQLRQNAEQNDAKGPITMIVGPPDVGKSTLSKILLNYSVRMGGLSRRPIFVDLDVGQGRISIPGTIGTVFKFSCNFTIEVFLSFPTFCFQVP